MVNQRVEFGSQNGVVWPRQRKQLTACHRGSFLMNSSSSISRPVFISASVIGSRHCSGILNLHKHGSLQSLSNNRPLSLQPRGALVEEAQVETARRRKIPDPAAFSEHR
jgi:hypothetical protein